MKLFKKLVFLVITLVLISTSIIFTASANALNFGTTKYTEPTEEFRSAWVCTVYNMDIGMQKGTDESAINAWKESYLEILNNAVAMNLNAIIFQVRPNNDAFYPSKYNPWSEYLVGYGVDPGWDPLEWMIEVTHEAGLEYHAWLNPYRTSVDSLGFSITEEDGATKADYTYDYDKTKASEYKEDYFSLLKHTLEKNNDVVDNPVCYEGDELQYNILYGTEGKFILNPASSKTIEHLKNTVQELVDNYDLDGIHFDDYFYPNDVSYKGTNTQYKNLTFSCEPDVDYQDYQNYLNTTTDTEKLEINDWRRENVNTLIQTLSEVIRKSNETTSLHKCAFGISPAARWAPDIESCPIRGAEGGMTGESCNNYYSYSDLFADVYKWVKEGWIDYILPQLYTNLNVGTNGYPTGEYNKLVKWWSNAVKGTNCKFYVGTAAYKVSDWISSKQGSVLELYYQVRWNEMQKYNVSGYVMFSYRNIAPGAGQGANAYNTITKYLWKNAALTPTYAAYSYESLNEGARVSEIKQNADGSYSINFNQVDGAKAYAIFAGDTLVKRVLSGSTSITLESYDSSLEYKLVTYGMDNEFAKTSDVIDFTKAAKNVSPTITFEGTINNYYHEGDTITGTFTITDPDSSNLTYELLLNTFEITSGTVNNNQVTLNYKVLDINQENYHFVLKVNDGFGDIVYETTTYQIGDEPTPTPEPTPEPEEEEEKSGCNKSATIIELFMTIILLGMVVIRKKK